jgi:endonuclease-3
MAKPKPDPKAVVRTLHELYPDADCALNYEKPHELLFATIMSAQTTDVNVNRVTETLFKKYRTVKAFADADPDTFADEIRSTGFFRNKTKSVLGAATMLVEEFDGRVPETMEELVRLPGVARKTANVVLGTYFGKPEGFVVDTHVRRLANRIGFTKESDPVKIEQDLMKAFPRDEWIFIGHALILHGRSICDAKKPDCPACPLLGTCQQNGVA